MFAVIFAAANEVDAWSFTITSDLLVKIIAGIAGTIVIAAITRAWPSVRDHFRATWRLRKAERAVSSDSPGIWIAPSFPIRRPTIDYKKSIPILVVANLKGGVGKTTTVANLAGHYARSKKKRVLALDMDFQGSLSRIVLSDADYNRNLDEQGYGSDSKAAQLVAGRDARWLLDVSEPIYGVPGARCIPAYYSLSITENRVLVEWIISKRADDIRFSIASLLHDPAVQSQFDMIIIDAPPRLTTGCIQALCAATHVLIPIVLDGLSSEAAGSFVEQLVINERLWPDLKLIGAFGNMTEQNAFQSNQPSVKNLRDFEADAEIAARDAIQAALHRGGVSLRASISDPILNFSCFIPNKTELGRRAGQRIVYLPQSKGGVVKEISQAFDRLGDEIDRRIDMLGKGPLIAPAAPQTSVKQS